jgi:ribosome-binding ATPase YchF (GTP1/OBG family)
MTSWHVDPSFDPLEDLRTAQEEVAFLKKELFQLQGNFHKLVQAHNAQANLVKQIARQNTELLEQMNWVNGLREKRL